MAYTTTDIAERCKQDGSVGNQDSIIGGVGMHGTISKIDYGKDGLETTTIQSRWTNRFDNINYY